VTQRCGIPDMRFINREVPIIDVARALDLRMDGSCKVHCWHPERHQHGDRTASVGIRKSNNTVKCFGCSSRPLGPIDLVMDVLSKAAADAALWIAERFEVPSIPARKRLTDSNLLRDRVGYERGLGLMIRSGLWGRLSEPAQAIAPVLLELAEKDRPTAEEQSIRISYIAITRYSGVRSPNAIRKALVELGELGFVRQAEAGLRQSPCRKVSLYVVVPNSNELWEMAQTYANQMRVEIEAERELRARLRAERIRLLGERRKESRKHLGNSGCE
jgi:hypothetical protein